MIINPREALLWVADNYSDNPDWMKANEFRAIVEWAVTARLADRVCALENCIKSMPNFPDAGMHISPEFAQWLKNHKEFIASIKRKDVGA